MLFYLLGILLAVYIYYKFIIPCSYWKTKGIPHDKSLPLVGSFLDLFLQRKHVVQIIDKLYNDHPNDRYVGFHQFTRPSLLLRDIDLIKQIGVREFDSFPDHYTIENKSDPLLKRNLLALRGNEWRKMRATLSPTFTSSKMRTMYVLMADCAKDFVKHYRGKKEAVAIEMKDIFSRYANDVIATTAFGIKINSVDQPQNEFFVMGRNVTNFGTLKFLKTIFIQSFPKIAASLKLNILGKAANFFRSVVKETITKRESENIFRPDLIQTLMEARKSASNDLKIDQNHPEEVQSPLSEDDIIAQALIFFFAGFDTVSTAACLSAYELARNPEIQRRLQDEIDEMNSQHPDGQISYDAIQSMKYLDQFISEALRYWTPGFITDRVCRKPFIIKAELPSETDLLIEEDISIIIPIMAIHRDPQYFDDPDRFDPDRFSVENKSKIVRDAYLPFGIGPRNCIGSRFALLELKTLFFYLLETFEIVPVDKTEMPLGFDPKSMNLIPRKGIWLGFKPRKVTVL